MNEVLQILCNPTTVSRVFFIFICVLMTTDQIWVRSLIMYDHGAIRRVSFPENAYRFVRTATLSI